MKLVLLGPPGAGKGTLAALIKERHGLAHISTGDIFREEMKSGSRLGQELKQYVDNGKLVPDEVVTRIIESRLTKGKGLKSGYMLDGFPRTRPQAEELDKILEKIQQPIDFALYMEASLSVIIQRLTGRRVCRSCGCLFHVVNKPPKREGQCDACGGELYQRTDDNEETIRTRMGVYVKSTAPIVEYYQAQGRLKKVDADRDAAALMEQLMSIWDENNKPDQDKISRRA